MMAEQEKHRDQLRRERAESATNFVHDVLEAADQAGVHVPHNIEKMQIRFEYDDGEIFVLGVLVKPV